MSRWLLPFVLAPVSESQSMWNDIQQSAIGGNLLDIANGNLQNVIANSQQNVTISDVYRTLYGTATIIEDVPIGSLVMGVDAMRQAGLLKKANVVTTPEAKKYSYPPTGTLPAQGACSRASAGARGKLDGGFTVCIPSSAVPTIDPKKESLLPRLSTDNKNVPSACRSILMSKGSAFDGSFCVSAKYDDDICEVGKYQGSANTVMYEAILRHDAAMNNVVIRCSVTKTSEGEYDVVTDVGYEVDQETAKLTTSSAGSQVGSILTLLPTLLSTSMITSLTGYDPGLTPESANQQGTVEGVSSVLAGIANLFINLGTKPVVDGQTVKGNAKQETAKIADTTTGVVSGLNSLANTISGVGSTAGYADIFDSFRKKRRLRGDLKN